MAILKSPFAEIFMSKIVMPKSGLKIGLIPQQSEWLASLDKCSYNIKMQTVFFKIMNAMTNQFPESLVLPSHY